MSWSSEYGPIPSGMRVVDGAYLVPVRNAKLCPDDVRYVRKKIADGVPKAQVARELGVSRSTIYRIIQGVVWKSVLLVIGCQHQPTPPPPPPPPAPVERAPELCEQACNKLLTLGCWQPTCVQTCIISEQAEYMQPMARCVLREKDLSICGVRCSGSFSM